MKPLPKAVEKRRIQLARRVSLPVAPLLPSLYTPILCIVAASIVFNLGAPSRLRTALVVPVSFDSERGEAVKAISIPKIDLRCRSEAEERGKRFRITLEYENTGARLMDLRREAYEKYGCQALWNIPGDATYSGMRALAENIRDNGRLETA